MDLTALRDEALAAAREITDPKDRANSLMFLAMKGLPERETVLDEAADIIRGYEDPKSRADGLTSLLIAAGVARK